MHSSCREAGHEAGHVAGSGGRGLWGWVVSSLGTSMARCPGREEGSAPVCAECGQAATPPTHMPAHRERSGTTHTPYREWRSPRGGHSNGRRSLRLTSVPVQFEFPQAICIINELKWRGFSQRTEMQPRGHAGGAGPSSASWATSRPSGWERSSQMYCDDAACILQNLEIPNMPKEKASPLLPCPGDARCELSMLEVWECFLCTRLRSSPTHCFSNHDLLLRTSICCSLTPGQTLR